MLSSSASSINTNKASLNEPLLNHKISINSEKDDKVDDKNTSNGNKVNNSFLHPNALESDVNSKQKVNIGLNFSRLLNQAKPERKLLIAATIFLFLAAVMNL